jgi:phage terminase small subunit
LSALDDLKPMVRMFVEAYATGMNGVESCREAGYNGSNKVLSVQADRLLKREDVRLALACFAAKATSKKVKTARQCLEWLTEVIDGDLTEKVTVGTKDDFVEVEVPAKIKDRVNAVKVLADLARYGEPEPPTSATMTPEIEEALADWMLVRDEPIVRELLERKRANE